LNKADRFFCGP